jgi:hypothetical protein
MPNNTVTVTRNISLSYITSEIRWISLIHMNVQYSNCVGRSTAYQYDVELFLFF